jgi:DNA mismatch repair protein MutL
VADPACDRCSAQAQHCYVNGRWVRDRTLAHAVQEAYRGLLMTGRSAVVFLFLEVPADAVDVNVHPAKMEVRFRDPNALHDFVADAIRSRLRAADLTARFQVGPGKAGPEPLPARPEPGLWADPPAQGLPSPLSGSPSPPDPAGIVPPAATAAPSPASVPGLPAPCPKAMQVLDSYLVVEDADGLLLIDQHALHERILFEGLKGRLASGPLAAQRLLVPEPVEVPARQHALALEHQEALAELGLLVEDFGRNTLLLAGYPALLARRPPRERLQTVLDHLAAQERPPGRAELLHELLSLMACHGAVRAGDVLRSEEIAALVARRELAADAHHCPHGRPTSLRLSRHDLERQFRRV